jgi:CubicO group peptidase (beta-lactamase class C family)
VTDERTRRLLAARLAEEQAGHRLPSVAAGLVRDAELVWSAGRGRIGGTSGPVPDADVQYRAGSITKTFVAVAVLRLRDEGRLGLSDPIGRHLTDAAGGDGTWTGLDGYFAGEPLRPVRGEDGRVVALDLASHTYTRLTYDAAAPVPGGVDPGGWRG